MSSDSPPPPSREPHLLRFGLRQMFIAVTAISILCALFVLTKGAWPMIIGVVTALIAAHIFGTLIGTRLRDSSREVGRWRAAHPAFDDDIPQAHVEPIELPTAVLPPPTPLADHGRVSHWLLWFVLGGALLGTVAGGMVLWLTIGHRIGWPGFLVGTISCGVLGTWVAFLASSFGSIVRHAWQHASNEGT